MQPLWAVKILLLLLLLLLNALCVSLYRLECVSHYIPLLAVLEYMLPVQYNYAFWKIQLWSPSLFSQIFHCIPRNYTSISEKSNFGLLHCSLKFFTVYQGIILAFYCMHILQKFTTSSLPRCTDQNVQVVRWGVQLLQGASGLTIAHCDKLPTRWQQATFIAQYLKQCIVYVIYFITLCVKLTLQI